MWRRRHRRAGRARSVVAAGQSSPSWSWTASSAANAATASSRRSASMRANGSCRPAPPIGCASDISSSSSTSFAGSLPILRGHGQVALLRRLRIEQENVRAALDWALTSSGLGEKGVELAGALFWFWTKRGLFEEGQALARTGARGCRARAGTAAGAGIDRSGAHAPLPRAVTSRLGARAAEALALGPRGR